MKHTHSFAFLTLLITMLLISPQARCENSNSYFSMGYRYILLENGTARITYYGGDMKNIDIPDSLGNVQVTEIGDDAFRWHFSVNSITIPSSITTIEGTPFEDCLLTSYYVSPDNPCYAAIDGVLFNKTAKILMAYPRSKKDRAYIIPEGIITIGKRAFRSCLFLCDVTVPDSVTTILDNAFEDSLINHLHLPDSVNIIADNAFANCSFMRSFSVSSTQPFYYVVDDVLFRKFDQTLFAYPAKKEAEFYCVPDDVVNINSYAFSSSQYLSTVILPRSVTSIGAYAFANSKSLTSVSIPDTIKEINEGTFSSCSTLTTISLPLSVSSIANNAFSSCESLLSVSIPASVTFIGKDAFKNCPNLTLTVPRNSYAAEYAQANNIPYTYPDANDWLYN